MSIPIARPSMSGRVGEQGRGGGRGGGRGSGRGGRGFIKKNYKKKTYTSNTPASKNDIFDCGKLEHAGLFEKSMKAIVNHHSMSGDNESNTIASMMENMRLQTLPVPPRPAQVPAVPEVLVNGLPTMVDDEARMIIWHVELKLIPARERDLGQGLTKMYATVWDQCSATVKSKLEQLQAYAQINLDKNPVMLSEEIRIIWIRL